LSLWRLKSRLSGENLPTPVAENLDLIESALADFGSVVAVLTAGYFSNALFDHAAITFGEIERGLED
jgi:uncharacterized circularly permuted ATP-grasp superfamily protein